MYFFLFVSRVLIIIGWVQVLLWVQLFDVINASYIWTSALFLTLGNFPLWGFLVGFLCVIICRFCLFRVSHISRNSHWECLCSYYCLAWLSQSLYPVAVLRYFVLPLTHSVGGTFHRAFFFDFLCFLFLDFRSVCLWYFYLFEKSFFFITHISLFHLFFLFHVSQ